MNQTLPECPVETTLALISNKWKVLILRELMEGTKRFSQIKNAIQGITQKVLTSNLRDMEDSGLLHRKIYPEVPPRVEYTLTEVGQSLSLVLDAMKAWGTSYKEQLMEQRQGSLDELAQKKILACRVICDSVSAEREPRFSYLYDCFWKDEEIMIARFQPYAKQEDSLHLPYAQIAALRLMIVRIPKTTIYGVQSTIALDMFITMKHTPYTYHLETMAFSLLTSIQKQLSNHAVTLEDPLQLLTLCNQKTQTEIDAMFLDTYDDLQKTYALDHLRVQDVRRHSMRNCM